MNLRELLLCSVVGFAPVVLSAQSSLDDLRERALGSAQEEEGEERAIPTDLLAGMKSLAETFDLSQIRLGGWTKDALESLRQGEDAEALGYLDRLREASLTESQRSLYQDVKVLVDAFVLERNFRSLPQNVGPTRDVVEAIRSGDYRAVTAELQELAEEVEPSAAQRRILESLQEQYVRWADPDRVPATAS